jgi:hypothetical protein
MTRLRLGDLVRVAPRALSRYTGTLLTVFVVQSLLAAACMLAIAMQLAQVFAHLPIFDEAVDGDLVSLIACLRFAKPSMLAIFAIVIGTLFVWELVTWFVFAGIVGVLATKPEGRAETARAFGAAGATTYLAYARLALCALPSYAVVALWLFKGLDMVGTRMIRALTIGELVGPLALAVLPALFLLHIAWTIVDYARVELSLRYDSHHPSVLATYARAAAFVLRRPITLVHGALGWIAIAIVWLGYAYLAQGHPMYGAEGAITLFVIRQGVALARTVVRFGVIAGQVELGKTRVLPSRRVEVKAEGGG